MTTAIIKSFLSELLPAVDFDSDFLFAELDSIGIATILYALSKKYDIVLDSNDVTPKNFKNIANVTSMVISKMTLESRIRHYAETTPEKPAAICAGVSKTYRELWNEILERAEKLSTGGLKPHRAYVFRANQDIDFIVTYCAVHYLKAVAVPLECHTSEKIIRMITEELSQIIFPDGIADTIYTTGTTGKSKGTMLSETYYVACADNFISDLGFSAELLFIINGPLNHIASLSKLHPTLTAGGTVYILDGLKDLNLFFKAFDLPFEKFATFMVPASLKLIMEFSYEKLRSVAPKIDFIETGAAPITGTDMERLSKALPHSRLFNSYGGTEIGCAATYNFNDGKYMEGCIGRPFKNSSVEISPEGHLIVSGPAIMSGYVNDPEGTAQVIIDGKVHMSDLGYADENGLIHLTGRLGDVINVGGFKVNPLEVENAASSYPGIKDCICIAADHPVVGTILKLLVVTDGTLDKHLLASHLKSQLDHYKVPTTYEIVDEIKRTYNGKIDRKFYRERQ